MVAAHHHRIGLTGQADIVGIMAFAAQQHRVLGARHRLADGEFLVEFEQVRIDDVVHGGILLRIGQDLRQDIANRARAGRKSA